MTRCASRWPSSSSARSTPRAGRPTRWPPTTAAAAPWPTSWGSSRHRPCAACTPPCWPTIRCPASAAPSCPTHLPPRNRSFVGRRGLLANVDATLDDDTRRPRAVALTGLGGVGKTELALELAHLRHRHGPGRLVDLRRRPCRHRHRARRAGGGAGDRAVRAPRGRPRGAVGRAGPHTGLAARLRQRGRAHAARAVPARGARTATSSSPRATRRGGASPTPSRSGRWPVASRWPTSPPAPVTGPSRRDTLAELLGDLPLALEQACAYIEQTRMSLPDYVSLFRRHRDGLLLREVEGSGRTVATTWGLAFDRLAVRAPRAAELLETIAFLAPDAISVAHAGPVRAGRAGAAGGAARAAAPVAGRPRGRHGAGAPAGAGRRACPDDRGGPPRPAGRRGARVRRPGLGRPRRPGRDVPDDVAAHLVCLAAARRGAGRAAGRAGRGPRAGGRPAGAAGALPGRRARAARGAAAAGRAAVAAPPVRGRADLRARPGARRRRRLAPALELHREAVALLDGTVHPDDRSSACSPTPTTGSATCSTAPTTRRGRDRRPPAGAGRAARGRAVRSGARGADRPRLHPVGQRRPGRRGGGAPRGPRRCWRSRGAATSAAGPTRPPGSAWSSRTRAGWTRRSPTSVRRSRRSPTSCGADHPDTAQTFDKLGYALRLQGKVPEAIEAHQRGVRLLERVLGPDDSRVAMALTNLGLALADAGELGAGRRRAEPRPDDLRGGAGAYPLQHVDGRRPAGRRTGRSADSRSAPGRSGPRSTRLPPNGATARIRPERPDSGGRRRRRRSGRRLQEGCKGPGGQWRRPRTVAVPGVAR